MFYMACELLNRPDLSSKPACVGRGMILTSNYVARRYGVRSAMAGFIGDKLVEELSEGREKLIHVPSNFGLYKEKSRIVKDVIREYDPLRMKSYSLDEVYLDIGPYLALFIQHREYSHEQIRDKLLEGEHICSDIGLRFLESQSPLVCLTAVDQIILRLRRHVEKATGGLTCSAGIARTHTIAKIASDKNKPNGQFVVDPANTIDFVRELPVRKIPGIGRVTEKLLKNVCNVQTGMDLYQKRGLIQFLFQPATAKFLLKASIGCSGEGSASTFGMEGETSSSISEHQKGISKERSFQPESDWAQLNIKLEAIARGLASEMVRKSIVGHTITVKVKLQTFDVLSRSRSQRRGEYVQNPEEVATIASGLFAAIRDAHKRKGSKKNHTSKFSVRLLGIRCSNLIQESLFLGKKKSGCIDKFLISSATGVGSRSLPRGESSPKTKIVDLESELEKKNLNMTMSMIANQDGKLNSASSPRGKRQTQSICDSDSNKNEYKIDQIGDTKSGAILDDHNNATIVVTNTKLVAHPHKFDVQLDEKNHATENENPDDEVENCDSKTTVDRIVRCPLCSRSFSASDNDRLNAHIDICLNGIHGGSTVRQVVQEEEFRLTNRYLSGATQGTGRRRRLLTDFWERG